MVYFQQTLADIAKYYVPLVLESFVGTSHFQTSSRVAVVVPGWASLELKPIVAAVFRTALAEMPVMVMAGAVKSRLKDTLWVAVFPAASVAVTTSTWSPAAETVLPLVKETPSSFAVVVPGCASVELKLMVAAVFRTALLVMPVTVMTGAV